MRENGKKVHILKDPKLRKIRYNLRAILWCEYQKRQNEIFERKNFLREEERKGKISSDEWWKKIQEIKKKDVKLQDALRTSPVNCMRCKSVKHDLQQDKWGVWECLNQEHELDEEGHLHPTSPFDENLVLWKF
jgi:hypothetical protein